MSQFVFGSGSMYVKRTDKAGVATVLELGVLQEGSVDFSATQKELIGGKRFAEAIAAGSMKVSGKCKFAKISAKVWSETFFGDAASVSTGREVLVDKEVHSIAAGSATATQAVDYVADMGVIDASTGETFTRVASAPAVGQFSLVEATGVYTFNTGDNGREVAISYTVDAADGQTVLMKNSLQGTSPTFEVRLVGRFEGKEFTMILNRCTASKLSMQMKSEDFMIPDFEFSASVDAADRLGKLMIATND